MPTRHPGFDLIAELHPTAAVAGTPTKVALDVIQRLEPFDRAVAPGRSAGSMATATASGRLPCAVPVRRRADGRTERRAHRLPVTAYAGAGIVAGSDPELRAHRDPREVSADVDALA